MSSIKYLALNSWRKTMNFSLSTEKSKSITKSVPIYSDIAAKTAICMSRYVGLGNHHFINIYDSETFLNVLIEFVSCYRYLKPDLTFLFIGQHFGMTDFLPPNFIPLVDIGKLG